MSLQGHERPKDDLRVESVPLPTADIGRRAACSRAVKRHAAELAFRQASHQGLPADLDIVDQTAREQAVPHVQSLRDAVEREGDERLGGRLCAHGVLECPLQKLLADAASLLIGSDEQLR
jgi:hypothetical protein